LINEAVHIFLFTGMYIKSRQLSVALDAKRKRDLSATRRTAVGV